MLARLFWSGASSGELFLPLYIKEEKLNLLRISIAEKPFVFVLPSPVQRGRARALPNFQRRLPSLNRSDDTEILAQGDWIQSPTVEQKFVLLVYILLVATLVAGRGFQPRTMKAHP